MKKYSCGCGTKFATYKAFVVHTNLNTWHKVARTARALRKAGVSYSEIARQTGTHKATIWVALRKEGL